MMSRIMRALFSSIKTSCVLRRVNEILGDHNVDKQMSDSRGDTAYMMADVSSVKENDIADLYKELEGLKARVITRILY